MGSDSIPRQAPLGPQPIVDSDPNPTFGLYFRRYAPFDTFAGLNPLNLGRSEGDKRTSASTSLTDTSRTYGCVMFTRSGIKRNFGGSTGTTTHTLLWGDMYGMSKVSMTVARSTLSGPDLFEFTASTAGGYPLLPSPDIDTTVSARIDFGSADTLRISGECRGDNFPALEVFLVCYRSKNTAVLVDGRTSGGRDSGPFVRLFEHENFPLCTMDVSLPLDKNGQLAGTTVVPPTYLPDYPKPLPAH